MYTAINLTTKEAITTTSKSMLCKFIGIDTTTLWRQLGKSSYLEYKEYIIVVTELTKIPRKGNIKSLRPFIERVREVNAIIKAENDYKKNM